MVFLPNPLAQICESYSTIQRCRTCDIYHVVGFCPDECFSFDRRQPLRHCFNSSFIGCLNHQRCSKTNFFDTNDQELWIWIQDSIAQIFPSRSYKATKHDRITSVPFDHPLVMHILPMVRDCDKQPTKFPPQINFFLQNPKTFHVAFESRLVRG